MFFEPDMSGANIANEKYCTRQLKASGPKVVSQKYCTRCLKKCPDLFSGVYAKSKNFATNITQLSGPPARLSRMMYKLFIN